MREATVHRNSITNQPDILYLTDQTFPTFEAFNRHVAEHPEKYANAEWTLVVEKPILSVQPYDGYNIEVIEPGQSSQPDQPAEGGDQ